MGEKERSFGDACTRGRYAPLSMRRLFLHGNKDTNAKVGARGGNRVGRLVGFSRGWSLGDVDAGGGRGRRQIGKKRLAGSKKGIFGGK